jgi:hypothetical protein
MLLKEKNNLLSFTICVGLLVIQVIIISWSLNRSFELTDESFYLVNYNYPERAQFVISKFYLVPKFIFYFLPVNIFILRLIHLVGSVMAGLFIFLGLKQMNQLLDERKPLFDSSLMLPVLVSFSLLSFCFGPLTLSYNSINSILISLYFFLFIRFIIRWKSREKFSGFEMPGITLLLSFVWGLIFLNKLSSAIALLPFSLAGLIFSRTYSVFTSAKNILIILLLFLVGVALAFAYCFSSMNNFNSNLDSFFSISAYTERHSLSGFLLYDAKAMLTNFISMRFIPVLCLLFLSFRFKSTLLFSASILVCLYLQVMTHLDIEIYYRFYVVIILLYGSIAWFLLNDVWKRRNLLLLLLPLFAYAGFAGSNLSFAVQVAFYSAFIFGFFLFVVESGLVKKYYFLAAFIALNIILTYHSVIAFPYKQDPLPEAGNELKLKHGEIIYVNKTFLHSCNMFKKYVTENRLDTFAYFIPQRDYYGYCYLMDKSMPYNIWITEGNEEFSRKLLSRIPLNEMTRSLLIFKSSYNCTALIDTALMHLNLIGEIISQMPCNETDTIRMYSVVSNRK